MHLGSWIVRPPHGNLRDAQSMAVRDKQNLRVKSETGDALLLKNDPRAFPAEGLEPALSIGKAEPHGPANKTVEQDAGLLAESGLAHLDQAAVQRPGTDGGVVPLLANRGD